MARDLNICPWCVREVAPKSSHCPTCHQAMVLPATESIAIWRLGEIRQGLLGPLAAGLRASFKRDVIIQPTFLDERLSRRDGWRGIASGVFLDQVLQRHQRGVFVNLGITEFNIVPNSRYNFLFGQAYLGQLAAVVSLHRMSSDRPKPAVLNRRLLSIAIHEIGHSLGLDHHSYEEEIDCVMVGDVEVDSIDTLDKAGPPKYCPACRRAIGFE
jgi:predicted Zn-dependent protease